MALNTSFNVKASGSYNNVTNDKNLSNTLPSVIYASGMRRAVDPVPSIIPSGKPAEILGDTVKDALTYACPMRSSIPDYNTSNSYCPTDVNTDESWFIPGNANNKGLSSSNKTNKLHQKESIAKCLHPDCYTQSYCPLSLSSKDNPFSLEADKLASAVPLSKYEIPKKILQRGFGIRTQSNETVEDLIRTGHYNSVKKVGKQLNRHYDWESVGINLLNHSFGYVSSHNQDSVKDSMITRNLKSKIIPDTVFLQRISDLPPVDHSKYHFTRNKSSLAKELANLGSNLKTQNSINLANVLRWENASDEPNSRFVSSHRDKVSRGCEIENSVAEISPSELPFQRLDRESDKVVTSVHTMVSKDHGNSNQRHACNCIIANSACPSRNDNVRASQLIYPSNYIKLGVNSTYFTRGRTFEECQNLAKKLNFGLTESEITYAFQSAQKDGLCNVEKFKNSCSNLELFKPIHKTM